MNRSGRRAAALRCRIVDRLAAGFLGEVAQAAALVHPKIFGPRDRLHLAPDAVVNDALFNTVSGSITVGAAVFFGHGVSVLTGTHDIHVFGMDRQRAIPPDGRDVVIEEGAWVSSNATVLGPCRIGANSVVAAGAVVVADVPAYAVVAGVPARTVTTVDPAQRAGAGPTPGPEPR